MIIALRTDKPEAELYLYKEDSQVEKYMWQAHRQLSETLLTKINELLERHNASLEKLTGIIVFQGPGSFTGLRIGITVANTLSYSLQIPIVGTQSEGWLEDGLSKLAKQRSIQIINPSYGSPAHITKPRK